MGSPTHLLVETGRASRAAVCDTPFANGQPGTENLSETTCPACLIIFNVWPEAKEA